MCELQDGGAQEEDGPSEGTARVPRRPTVRTPSALSARPFVRDGKVDSEHDQHQCPATAKAAQAVAEAELVGAAVPRRSGRACRGLGGGSSRGNGPGGPRTEGRRQRRRCGRRWPGRVARQGLALAGGEPATLPKKGAIPKPLQTVIAAEKRGHHELRRACRRAVTLLSRISGGQIRALSVPIAGNRSCKRCTAP